jgi:hypothetical protein
MCRTDKTPFVPLDKEDLGQAKTNLLAAIECLDARLELDGSNGQDWRNYLKWVVLEGQLSGPEAPDLEKLDAVHARFARKYEGLGLVWFDDARVALSDYLTVARAIDNPDVKAGYEQLLGKLAEHLKKYEEKPTAEGALVIGEALRLLVEFHQADELVAGIRQRYARPNLFIRVSADLIGAGIAEPVDDTTPIVDCILRTAIYGTGRTRGETTVELFSDPEDGVIDAVFRGITHSDTVGYHGPVRIYSRGVTRIDARKRFLINDRGIKALPAVSEAVTSTTIDGIGTRRGSRMIERAAWRRVGRNKGKAEWIAARHAEQRVNRRIDRQSEGLVARANERFEKKFRRPLWERKLFPHWLRFSTTEESLRVTALRAEPAQLAAAGPPPPLDEKTDLGVRIHESMIENMATTALAGVTLDEDQFVRLVTDVTGSLPERLKPEEGKASWSISFARRRPISVVFDEDGFSVTIRAWKYGQGGKEYPAMNVTATYKIERSGGVVKAVRQGELEIFPPGFVVGKNKLSVRQQTIRRLLERRFGKIFEQEMVPKPLKLSGKWSKAGELSLAQWNTAKGWLVLAWRR